MKTGNSLRILIIVLAAMLTFAACGQPGGDITPTKPNPILLSRRKNRPRTAFLQMVHIISLRIKTA